MKYLVTNGKINLNGTSIDLSKNMVPLNSDKIKEIDGWIDELSAIKEVSQKLNINFYRDYENEQLINQLNILLNFMNDRGELSEHEIIPAVFNYGERLIGILKTKNNYWNFFDENLGNHIQLLGCSKSNKEQIVKVNPYLITEQYQNSITKYIGYNFDVVFQWFRSHVNSFKNEVVRNQATIFCEDLMMNSKKVAKDNWIKISKLQSLMGHFDDNRLFLDHMLVQKTLDEKMTIDENGRLNNLAHTGNAVEQLYASYLLNIEMNQKMIANLNAEELDWLKGLRIVPSDNMVDCNK